MTAAQVMTILWWHWLALGLVLVALEMTTAGGFYMVFFGIAAIGLSVLRAADLGGPLWSQLILFSVLALGALLLRSPVLRWLQLDRRTADVDSLVGDLARPLEAIAPGAVGRAELRGTVWSARNGAARALVAGERCRVVTVEQLLIMIEPEGAR
jgi:membrane protein implicated in regulation of membrane protease activity